MLQHCIDAPVGSCRTNSTGLKQAQTGSALNATSTSPAATFMNTQDSNRHGRKRKASRAEVCWPCNHP